MECHQRTEWQLGNPTITWGEVEYVRECLAEFIGTFFLCFCGIAAILSTQAPLESGAGLVGIALAHGLAVAIAVSIFGGVSGAHINPAVTCGMLATGRIRPPMALSYIVSQCLAGTVAAFLCGIIFASDAVESAKLGIPLPPPESKMTVSTGIVLLVEFILTFFLVTAVFGTAVDERGKAVKIGGLAIGLTVTMNILAGGAVTGASMNPARSFGPALAYAIWGGEGAFYLHWCYWVAPIAGAVVAALLYHHVILREDN